LLDSVGVTPDQVRGADDLQRIPVSSKDDLRRAGEECVAREWDGGRVHRASTSGTTGSPLTVFIGDRDRVTRLLHDLRCLIRIGVRPWHRLAILMRREHLRLRSGRSVAFRFEHVSGLLPVEQQMQALARLRPDLLWTTPITLRLLVHGCGGDLRRAHVPSKVVTAAATMPPELKRIMADHGIEHFDFYGAVETGRIAWECTAHSGLHVDFDNVVLETVPTGESDEVVVTALNGFAMPFIRYRLGDLCAPVDAACPCGSAFPLIDHLVGRTGEVIRLPGGGLVSPRSLVDTVQLIAGLRRFQISQRAPDHLLVELCLREPMEPTRVEELRTRLLSQLGEKDIRLDIRFVDEIETPSDKARDFVPLQEPASRQVD
jgi:phenylacetate-CoA ligase